jgi:LPXTG-motif cell wall-anchored protein
METFQQVMYGFYALLILGAIAIGVWFYKKRKESQE